MTDHTPFLSIPVPRILHPLLFFALFFSVSLSAQEGEGIGQDSIRLIGVEQPLPEDLVEIGEVWSDEADSTEVCDYDSGIRYILERAEEMGADAAKISNHWEPDSLHPCHLIEAAIFKYRSESDSLFVLTEDEDELDPSPTDEDDRQIDPYYVEETTPQRKPERGFKLRISPYLGVSSQLGEFPENIDPFVEEHLKQIRSGAHLGGSVLFSLNRVLAIGANYSRFTTFNDTGVRFTILPNGMPGYRRIKEDILIQSYGVTVAAGTISRNMKWDFRGSLSIAVITYLDDAVFGADAIQIKGFTVGSFPRGEVAYFIDRDWSIGVGIGIVSGALSQYDVTENGETTTVELEFEEYESVSRVDLSVGIHWYPGRKKLIARSLSR